MGALCQDKLADWPSVVKWDSDSDSEETGQPVKREKSPPCGGGVQYLHRDPASRRWRRKWKSQIWDSKIMSRVPRDSDPRRTALARTSWIWKRHTRPLVREDAPQKQDCNCQKVIINIWSWAYWLTDRQSHCDFDFDLRRDNIFKNDHVEYFRLVRAEVV
jgi:hypothetical protein